MRAAVIDHYGKSSELKLRDLPAPTPGPRQILIRVHASSVNPVDWKIRRGSLRGLIRLHFPIILGGDVAGVVESVGPGVRHFQPGDPVFAMLSVEGHGPGGYAELAVADESAAARKPNSLSFEEAAAIPIAGLTALQSFRDLGNLAPGQSALIIGGSGGVGTFAVSIAKAAGATVTAVCGPNNVDLVRSLGADQVIDYSREDFTTREDTYHVILDAVAKSSFTACAPRLRLGGTYISTLPSPGLLLRQVGGPLTRLLNDGKSAKFVIAKANGSDLAFLGTLADQGKLKPVIDRVYPLDQIKDAHDYSESERARGKIVLRVV